MVALAVVAAGVAVLGLPAGAANTNPAADLDQCENGKAATPKACDWVDGNLNGNNSHYGEGDSVPFRVAFRNLSVAPATHTVTIEWDTTKSGKHAYDYLTTYNRTQAGDPCAGVSGCANPTTFPIPADSSLTPTAGFTGTQVPGNFTIWNGSIVQAGLYTRTGSAAADGSTRLTLTFAASTANPVLAWSGHIGTRLDWGANSSASSIAGSPYHMRLLDLDGDGGNQDRSLSAESVIFPGSITIVKQASPEGSRQFSFTGSDNLGNFTLVDDGLDNVAPANFKKFEGLTGFYDNTTKNTYDFTETVPTGWELSSITCGTGAVYTADTATRTVSIKLAEGTDVTCTFSNTDLVPTISVSKTPNVASVTEPGGPVAFAVGVTNNSTVEPVTLTTLSDSVFGNIASGTNTSITSTTCAVPQVILATASYNCSFTATVSGNGGATHANTVTATVTDADARTITGTASAQVAVTDVPPRVALTKTPGQTRVRAGTPVTYAYKVTNPGTEPLVVVTLTDDKCSPVTFTGGDTDADGDLDSGEEWAYSCTATLAGTTVNTASVVAEDDEGTGIMTTATARVEVINPKVAIDKSADPVSASPGQTVTYTYLVTNPGDGPLTDVQVSDDKCSPVSFVGGDTDGDQVLDQSETWTYSCAQVVGSSGDSLTNIGTVTAKDPTGATVSADDTETIAIVLGLTLERSAPPEVIGVDLPRTGAGLAAWATTATALIGMGAGLLVAGRRRRTVR